jgi:hypothetical protein
MARAREVLGAGEADVVIGARQASGLVGYRSGEAYIIYGRTNFHTIAEVDVASPIRKYCMPSL